MKTTIRKSKNQKKNIIFVVTLVVFLIAAGLLAYYFLYAKDQHPDGGDGRITSDQVENPSSDATNEGQVNDNKTITPAPSTSNPGTDDIEKATITRASVSGDNLRISAIFSQPTTGTCTLSLEKDGQTPITQTVDVVVGATYYACDGFRIPLSQFPVKGDWTVNLNHTINTISVPSDKQTVTIQ